MDTLAIQTCIDRQTKARIAAGLRQQETRHTDGTTARKSYGALTLSRLTLYESFDPIFPTYRLVVEFSVGRVLHGHNLNTGEVGANAALGFVLDEIEGRSGCSLHAAPWMVCRLDVARTILGPDATPYLREAAAYRLPRRETIAYETGVRFGAKSRAELLYDKRASVLKELAEATETAELPGLISRSEGLKEAVELVANGAIRIECRVKGSPNVAKALGLTSASWPLVVRDVNAFKLISSFLAHFDFGQKAVRHSELEVLRTLSAAQAFRLLGFLHADQLVTSDDEWGRIGFSAQRLRRMRGRLRELGLPSHGSPLDPLVVTQEDFAHLRMEEERKEKTWQIRRNLYRTSFPSLQPVQELLVA